MNGGIASSTLSELFATLLDASPSEREHRLAQCDADTAHLLRQMLAVATREPRALPEPV